MSSTLVEFFKHNRWANLRLLDACANLTDSQLQAALSGTYGAISATLVHLLAAEGRYVGFLTGQMPDQPLHEDNGFPGFDVLRQHAERSGQALIDIAATFDERRVLRGVRRGRPYEMPAVVPILQAINHATEHRAHVVTILTQQGIEPPEMDIWAYQADAMQG